jgi:hypothetical protein
VDRFRILSNWVIIVGFIFLILEGCSEDERTPDEYERTLNLSTIIVNPLTPTLEPKDSVVILSVRSDGSAPRGDEADFTWTVDAGSLSTNKGYYVKWYRPDSTGLYNISVRGVLGGIERIISKKVAVRNFERIDIPELKKHFFLTMMENWFGPRIHFVGYPTSRGDFNYLMGGSIFNFDQSEPPFESITHAVRYDTDDYFGGDYFRFYPEGDYIVGSSREEQIEKPNLNIFIVNLSTGIGFNVVHVTRDDGGYGLRRNQHIYPWGTNHPDPMLVWEQHITGEEDDGSEDLFNIGFCNNPLDATPTIQTITESLDSVLKEVDIDSIFYPADTMIIGEDTTITPADTTVTVDSVFNRFYYRNIKPLFTPDEQSIIYFVDGDSIDPEVETFEPCIIDLNGEDVDIDSRRVLGNGIFKSAGIRVSEETVFQWKPGQDSDILGFIEGGGHLCFLDYDNALVEVVEEPSPISEFVWSENECIAIDGGGMVKVNLGGGVDRIFNKDVRTDKLTGLCCIGDISEERKILCQVVRSGKSLVDTVAASYSALMAYTLGEVNEYYYLSPRIPVFFVETPEVTFPGMRTFNTDGIDDLYFPVSEGDGIVRIYHSYW